MKTITVPVQVTEAIIVSSLVSALEGGSNYWYRDFEWQGLDAQGKRFLTDAFIILEKETGEEFIVTPEHILAGLVLMAEREPIFFAMLISGRGDASTADVLLQFTVFQERKYA